MVFLNTLSLATLALFAIDVSSAEIVHKREPKPTAAAAVYARQATGAFSDFSGSLPASVSSIISTITSGTPSSVPTATAATTYPAGAKNPFISNAPPLPAGELSFIIL